MAFVGVLRGVWIPPVILAAIGSGGLIVLWVRAGFASVKRVPAAPRSAAAGPFNQKSTVYEAFAPVGTVAEISYFDVDADPHRVDVVAGQVEAERVSNEVSTYTHCLVKDR
jgi:hypothetical protein